ncbi:MAG: hypothetical protein HOH13_00070 [Crocinitomicaceae bacterium]|nr:hypothetical protein [Crocinitomicaceae bacterium]
MEAIDDSSKSELCWYFVSTNCLAQRVAIEEFYHEYFLIEDIEIKEIRNQGENINYQIGVKDTGLMLRFARETALEYSLQETI